MNPSRLLLTGAVLAIALPALAQDRPQTGPERVQGNAAAPESATRAPTTDATATASPGEAQGAGDSQTAELEQPPGFAPPVELPDHARRDPARVGRLDPVALGLGAVPWRGASGAFLSSLMQRMDTPIASRWAHIALRNLLLARAPTPRNVNPVDWTAERAFLLLRLGEADAARMLVSGVDVDRFTPAMFQVAVQSALANADPSGLCPLQRGISDVEPRIFPLVEAMCAALTGEPESAASQIEAARRRGRLSAIDLALADKVVGAAANTGRAVTVEWEPVERLNAWRFGLATATGMTFPERLIDAAPVQLRAWQARAPLIAPQDRLESAEIAAGLGVFSSQAMIDLHSLIYESTGPDEIPATDAWQLRLAFVGEDQDARLAAMRRLWSAAEGRLEREATRAMLGRAASRIDPAPELEADAPNLIASMLAAGLDREAARWARVVNQMDGADGDAAWAMLALAAPDGTPIDLTGGRISGFVARDDSRGRKRGALLVAGLAGLGRLAPDAAGRLNGRFGLRLDRRTRWTRMIDAAAALGQSGTVLVLTGTGMQTAAFEALPPSHLFHAVSGLNRTGQDFTARMIAAEALSRT